MDGKEEYCKYCQMQYHKQKCIASTACRPRLCAKARARMLPAVTQGESPQNPAKGVREYLKYIAGRIDYIKRLGGDIPSNELRYYRALRKAIKEWGESHVAVYGYLYGRITAQQARGIIGVSERQFFRMLDKQCADLVAFIEGQEKALEDKYPFIPMADLLEKE